MHDANMAGTPTLPGAFLCVITHADHALSHAQALALHGASVTLTDLPVCLELLRYNVALNFAGKTEGELLTVI